MSNLKTLALTLVEVCERTYRERTILESMMDGARVPGWRGMYLRLSNDQQMQDKIHAQFQLLYDLIKREGDVDKAILELIRVLPKPDKLN